MVAQQPECISCHWILNLKIFKMVYYMYFATIRNHLKQARIRNLSSCNFLVAAWLLGKERVLQG
jgi:uncharacterized membrane protein SirB2